MVSASSAAAIIGLSEDFDCKVVKKMQRRDEKV
jgi:hypothetical protein